MKKSAAILGLALVATLLAGCVTRPVSVSQSTWPTEHKDYSILGKTMGTATSVYLLGFIPLTVSRNPAREALDDAMNRKGGDALLDVAMDQSLQYYILFSIHKTKVHGTCISIKR